jgi:hypothetical protein
MGDVWPMFCAGVLHFLQSLPCRMKPQPPTIPLPLVSSIPRLPLDCIAISRVLCATPSCSLCFRYNARPQHTQDYPQVRRSEVHGTPRWPLAGFSPPALQSLVHSAPCQRRLESLLLHSKQFVGFSSSQQFVTGFFSSIVLPYFERRKRK